MEKRDLRVQYSGFVIFAAKMASVLTGLIFQFMITRSILPAPDGKKMYDLWFNINDLAGYFTLLAGIFPFWTMRAVARQKEGAIKTGFLANLTISVIATLIYLPLIPIIISSLGISAVYLPVYFLISIQIIELYSITVLESCLQACIPQTVGYGLIIQQVLRVIVGYVLIIQLNQLLLGAVVTVIISFALQTVYYVKLLVKELKQRIRWEYVREWLKGSLLNIYAVIGTQLAAYIFILLFAYGGEGARGRLGAAAIVVNVINYSSFLAFALYPKLLAEKKPEDVTASLKTVLMFAIPLTVGAIALSDSYITILTETYTDAAPVLIVLAIDAFVNTVSGITTAVVWGFETVDEGAKLSLKQLVRSRLFIAFSLSYLHSAITIPTAFYVLTNYAGNQPLQAALAVSIINFSGHFGMFLIQYAIARKMTKIEIPWRSIAKYALAAAAMGSILYLIPHPTRIYVTVVETAVGGIIYLALLMAIDKEARRLPGDMIQELRHKGSGQEV